MILGVCLKNSSDEPWSSRDAMYVSFIGMLFLNMLKCIMIPLIIPSLIAAIGRQIMAIILYWSPMIVFKGSMDLSLSGKVGLRAVVYYMTTTVLAVILGIILVTSIRPGAGGMDEEDLPEQDTRRNITTADTLMDLLRWGEKTEENASYFLFSGTAFHQTLSKQACSSTGQSSYIRGKKWLEFYV